MDDETVLNQYGGLSLRTARLDDAAHRICEDQVHLPYPPRVFISYRRCDEKREKLIDQIVGFLQDLNFEIVSDRAANLQGDADVDQFVAQIVQCSFFVPVITYDYLEGIGLRGTKTSYVYDELMMALVASEKRQMHIVPVLIEGGFSGHLYAFQKGGYIDAQDGEISLDKLSQYFQYAGPCLTPSEKGAVSKKAKRAAEIEAEGRTKEAVDLLGEITDEFPFVRNAWAGRIGFLLEDEQNEEAISLLPEAINSIIPYEDRSEVIAMAMELNFNAGAREKAFRFALDFLEEIRAAETKLRVSGNVVSPISQPAVVLQLSGLEIKISKAHYIIGTYLDDKGDFLSARNHMLLALEHMDNDEIFLNDLGYVYKNLGCWESARKFYQSALEVNPAYQLADLNLVQLLYAQGNYAGCREACTDLLFRPEFEDEAPGLKHFLNELKKRGGEPQPSEPDYKDYIFRIAPAPWFKCSACAALYPNNSSIIKVCGRCAGLYQANLDRCFHCGNDAYVPIDPAAKSAGEKFFTRCPTCNKGRLVRDDHPDLCAAN